MADDLPSADDIEQLLAEINACHRPTTDGPTVQVNDFLWCRTTNGPRYRTMKLRTAHHEVEVTISPTGRNVHVWVDGKKWEACHE